MSHLPEEKKTGPISVLTRDAADAPVEPQPLHRIPSESNDQAHHRHSGPAGSDPSSTRSFRGDVLAPDHGVRLTLNLLPRENKGTGRKTVWVSWRADRAAIKGKTSSWNNPSLQRAPLLSKIPRDVNHARVFIPLQGWRLLIGPPVCAVHAKTETRTHVLSLSPGSRVQPPPLPQSRQGFPRNRTCDRVCCHVPRLSSLHRTYCSAVGAKQRTIHLEPETDDVFMVSRLARSISINPKRASRRGYVLMTRIVTLLIFYFGFSSLGSLSWSCFRLDISRTHRARVCKTAAK